MSVRQEQEEREVEDLGVEVEGADPFARDLSPRDRLQFAKWVLKGVFAFFVISVGVWLYRENDGETLFDVFKTGILPIATFVIGDYFGSRGR